MEAATPRRDLVVVGASLEGVGALMRLAADLPPDFPAALCVVQHTSAGSPGLLPRLLADAGPLPAALAEDGEPLRGGRLYVAPPDRHLLVEGHHLRVVYGPRENRTRPAIDPLFRTAAVAGRSRTVGVVLTGLLDDGAAGLRAIKRCGGLAVVQSPEDAAAPEMPTAALAAVAADYVRPLSDMGALLSHLVREAAPPPPPIPEDLLLEARLTVRVAGNRPEATDVLGETAALGTPSGAACPECGGPLWAVRDASAGRPDTDPGGVAPARFRCHLGHAYTARALDAGQAQKADQALWAALRLLEERARMLASMARLEHERGRLRLAADLETRAAEQAAHADSLRRLMAAL